MFKEKPGKLASVLGGYTIMWWSVYGGLKWAGWFVSRRMVCLTSSSIIFEKDQANLLFLYRFGRRIYLMLFGLSLSIHRYY